MEGLSFWITALGVPGIISACMVAIINRNFKRAEIRERSTAEACKRENYLMMKSLNANGALAEATALAIKRKRCNGEMEAALEYYTDIKHELKDYLLERNAESLHGGE